ncbi:MAG: hypothetical protein E7270_00305 [Lachnospiraceae bacterium]|nr:hypothetical protein [Lachnospiraceae bacterium]
MEKKIEKIIIAIFMIIVMLSGFVYSKGYRYVDEMIDSVVADVKTENGKEREKDASGNVIPSISTVLSNLSSGLLFKQDMVDINGSVAKNLGMREIYKNSGGVVLENGYVVGVYKQTTTDYEIQQMKGLKKFLDERDIDLLYVNAPTKYYEDSYVEKDLGIKSYVNDNANRFLERLDEAGINYIDLREHLVEKDSFEYFFKTDHHWTPYAGKTAAKVIVEELNNEYGYDIDLSLYDDNNFTFKEYKNAWLGEQGRKLGVSYVGLDDYTSVLPKYDTSFTVVNEETKRNGKFEEVLVSRSTYLPENNTNKYLAKSWHYSYNGNTGIICNNNVLEGKKILVLGDSMAVVTNTFLALGVSEVRGLVLRGYNGSIREHIEANDYDIVIVAYLETMIGAHDDESSANYKMFNFE